MTEVGWSIVEVASQLLERDERETVLGDLAEAGESAWRGLHDVLGLVIRRQAILWKNWRPWLAAFGVSLPGSFFLMGFSLSVSLTFRQIITTKIFEGAGPGFLLLICHAFLLVGWSWSSGFVVGSVARRTLWVSIASCCFPCLFCLARFRVESLSRFCLLLFVLPAIWGVRQGLRITRIKLSLAVVLAVAITVLTIPTWSGRGQPWWSPPALMNWILGWPAWYLLATARRPGRETERS